ncbi:hypothetical protein [Maridesulfovibrio hydrothermalis]|uniref:Uncharacterized protein n=1 Tax=Maridesulfovibrio hydrothermalis AM13 = DSM 14728 TaxID=1121451 RepID=L0R948_9BACT|nr:hypothetical protein [Maridesulfovibrio hydrothermalis]CCO22747.1 conserved protein of unknown function [Maridesulfovibrio hydrothermalis AM13 = DSM 14728]
MADVIREAVRMRKKYGWKTYLIKFKDYYSYTFDPSLFPEFELLGEVGSDGAITPSSQVK